MTNVTKLWGTNNKPDKGEFVSCLTPELNGYEKNNSILLYKNGYVITQCGEHYYWIEHKESNLHPLIVFIIDQHKRIQKLENKIDNYNKKIKEFFEV